MISSLAALLSLGVAASVTPSGASVPENLLRMELSFDRPLPSFDMRFASLLDASGKRIDDALLDIALPDKDGRSLAILMHPGRIKRGVGPNLEPGPALREGENVTLVIDDPRLARPVTRTWRVAGAARHPIAPALWRLSAPGPNRRQPLSITFPSAINASAVELIAVATSAGKRLAGKAWLSAGETEWHFVPSSNWKAGVYDVRVHPTLEDPAGNRVCSAFEQARQSAERCDGEARVQFHVYPAAMPLLLKPTRSPSCPKVPRSQNAAKKACLHPIIAWSL